MTTARRRADLSPSPSPSPASSSPLLSRLRSAASSFLSRQYSTSDGGDDTGRRKGGASSSAPRPLKPGFVDPSTWRHFDSRAFGINHDAIPKDALGVLRRLRRKGFEAYLVGGCVRDLLLKRVPKDFDVITTASLEQIKKNIFRRCMIIGRRFPICMVKMRGSVIEVSSFQTIGKHANKSEEADSEELNGYNDRDILFWKNSMRRDFTINGLFFNPMNFKIYDYVNGVRDMRKNKVCTVIPAHISFMEDPARILRGLRIAARLGFQFSGETSSAIHDFSSSIIKIDKARLMMEMNYMLSYGAAEPSVRLLRKYGLLDILLPFQAAYLSDQMKSRSSDRDLMLMRAARFRCCAEPSSQEQEISAAPPTRLPEKPARAPPSSLLGISTSTWSAGVAGLGFLETGYLTYLKLTGSEAFCPISGGGCSDVLESDYSVVFGIPLPLVGLVAYGLVAALSLQEDGKDLLPGLDDLDIRLTLLLIATSMATASAYFLYILSTKFVGVSCSYCLLSAFLSFSLLFIRVKDFGFERIQKFAGIQLSVAVIIALALTNSYSSATTQLKSADDFVLEPYQTEITTESSPFAIALARHLHSIGAKMYGAFWCSHCNEQKQMFGREAAKILDYVECFPNGAGKGKKMTQECQAAGLEGFPTWFINGKVLSGDQELEVLAEASGFVAEGTEQSKETVPN